MQKINGPIPGQSLTAEPSSAPWERPPEIVDPEEAAKAYLSKMEEPERVEAALDALEMGLTVKELTLGMLRAGVSEGMHSIDVSLIIAPVVHEQISSVAKAAGIDFEEGIEEKRDRAGVDYAINKHKARKMIKKIEAEGGEPVEEETDVVPEFQSSRGLMAPQGDE